MLENRIAIAIGAGASAEAVNEVVVAIGAAVPAYLTVGAIIGLLCYLVYQLIQIKAGSNDTNTTL